MANLQNERFRHLVSNAILEVWKKESGSLSSVAIEGTICITTGSGRTTIVHLNDKYAGSIPEYEKENSALLNHSYNGPSKGPSPRYGSNNFEPSLDFRQSSTSSNNTSAVQAYLDELSPASLISPTNEIPHSNHDKNNNADHHGSESILQKSSGLDSGIGEDNDKTAEFAVHKMKDEFPSDDEGDNDSLNSSRNSNAGPVCPGTGYYTPEKRRAGLDTKKSISEQKFSLDFKRYASNGRSLYKRVANDHEESINDSVLDDLPMSDGPGPMMSTPKPSKYYRKSQEFSPVVNGYTHNTALDLSKREDDLLLSSPHNYTNQVRDVIRQRLVAQKSMDEGVSSEHEDSNSNVSIDEAPALSSSMSSSSLASNLPHMPSSLIGHHHLPKHHMQLPPHLPSASMLPFYDYPLMFSHVAGKPHPHALQELISGAFKRNQMPPLVPIRERSKSVEPVIEENNVADNSVSSDKDSANAEQKVYKCDFCSKTFLFKSKYHEHLPVHTNARPFQCRLCSRTYKYKYDLRVHLRTHMGIPTKSTVCPFCNAKFDTNKLLRLHIKDAHKERHKYAEEDCAQLYEGVL